MNKYAPLNRTDLAQSVTDKLLALIEKEGQNWKRPWVGDGLHRNAVTGKPYRGINVMLTGLAGLSSAHWATYAQWGQLGAQVRKGEKATKIVFWKPVVNRDEETDETKTGLIAKEYAVFNIEQVDNAPALKIEPLPPLERHAICEDVIAMTGARIDHRGDRAFYHPQTDLIVLPKIEQFTSAEGYYSTAWHEITHWSGHVSRLDRNLKGRFGDESYAVEEIIAELGSAILCAALGIEPEEFGVEVTSLKIAGGK